MDTSIDLGVMQASPRIVDAICRPCVLLMVRGSRGDIEVFLGIAMRLQGYRVRIATHPAFQDLVTRYGFGFYDIGGSQEDFTRFLSGDPNVVFSFKNGELASVRRSVFPVFEALWRATYDRGESGAAGGNSIETMNVQSRPFVAEMIVSSPQTVVHYSAAEKLRVPLVLVSAQPVLPTPDFPHVFTMGPPTFVPGHWWNSASYRCLGVFHYLTFGSLLKRLRVQQYDLHPIPWLRAMRNPLPPAVPFVNLWSSSVLSKPTSWPANAEIAGFTFLPLLTPYMPPPVLQNFLSNNPKPLLVISFGSIYIPKPRTFLPTLLAALTQVDATVIINRSWSAHHEGYVSVPQNVHITDSVPHAWLLPQASAFIHHGGAGHTAAGLRAGVPMLLVPFLRDQFLWAAKVHKLGLGPPPLGFQDLTSERLVERFRLLPSSRYQDACDEMATRVQTERDGAEILAETVQKHMDGAKRKCEIFETLEASWRHAASGLKVSDTAATCLVQNKVLGWDDLHLLKKVDWEARWHDASPQRKWIRVLETIFSCYSYIRSIIHAISRRLAGLGTRAGWMSKANCMTKVRDPVRQAKIEQAEFDWHLVGQDLDENEVADLNEGIVLRWKALVKSRSFMSGWWIRGRI